ncbi:AraC family transcriptional regulator [Pedobacter heparinus]|uniref:Helix-turn-helix-domain containing protein AraC type n=1 Tax=Pedobacter heparinus (strain ATCC 13125 / DSM 2366 / CIP 104194 / JCM 7457 / NBRC 12017 / NCIMB 9290 / NRRL B-14731 / HIM 762-3) TaxID=485917 RepID=C6XTJ9_PEDHD|nr:helix-turn-helix domain-containing protein [Pedobacter heparinus]ACU05777.1 helix-turn-helix- domain containing protein AraC type [Pedobacter heparinus DSM 2366]
MKDFIEQVLKATTSTITLAEGSAYHALNNFHNHQEIELVYVRSGEGTFSIGHTSKRISSGAMILIGTNIPHMFKFESNRYYDYAMKHAKRIVPLQLLTLHFDPYKLGNDFLKLPENIVIKDLLDKAKKGLLIPEQTKLAVIEYLKKIESSLHYEQLPLVLQLLNKIGVSEEIVGLSAYNEKKTFKKIDETRLTMVYLYTMDNFYKEIKLEQIANVIHMVPNAFCHYFKSRTGRTYFDFLIAVRIEHACKLLRESNDSVNSVCRDSGFSNLSNFNRYFKLQTEKSPLEYRRSFRN